MAESRTTAIKVEQWLPEWDRIKFDAAAHQAKPPRHFYLASISPSVLRSLSDVSRRSVTDATPRRLDLGIQRFFDQERAGEISRFVRFGFPWSQLTESQRKQSEFADLQKPGWLPTAIIVNILPAGEKRGGGAPLAAEHAIRVVDGANGAAELFLPDPSARGDAEPAPIEVIDGQHRLWAFEEDDAIANYQLPVVAFIGLDISWQAYLFWTINITPRRINSSLAFDLIPLLRAEDWLDRFTGHAIYRQARSQELVEALWLQPESPWHQRINMLGESAKQREDPRPMVSQASWVRSLMATYVRKWEVDGTKLGGLFGAPVGQDETVLPWSRTQQSAFLVTLWDEFRRGVAREWQWAEALRASHLAADGDAAFFGQHSFIPTDQGVRAFLSASNDVFFSAASEMPFAEWQSSTRRTTVEPEAVSKEIQRLREIALGARVAELAGALAAFDWRTARAPGLSRAQVDQKQALKGSSGYRSFRLLLLDHLGQQDGWIGDAALAAASALRR